ncbi:MAG TPA: 4Fe-4S double cluster binding domain-containing protein [Thermodesulfovibrionales bacterium]|jgi:epoxyqueuosine reductase QueG|nr:4Fe-4S double cluster binding domain-containing protein [Thermodesulfovibrionales bacterium]
MEASLREELMRGGATVVGFAILRGSLGVEIAHLETAVSIGVDRKLNEDTISLLVALQKKAARRLKQGGYRYLAIPPDSDRIQETFVSKLYPSFTHKMAATSSGIGWIGKNGLLISPHFGPRLSLATVLTNAPLRPDEPIEFSRCGDCSLCIDFCPSGAVTGESWSRYKPFVELIRLERCRSHKNNRKRLRGKPNCGLCINICPYGRKKALKGLLKKPFEQVVY